MIEFVGDQTFLRAIHVDRIGLQRWRSVIDRLRHGRVRVVLVKKTFVLTMSQDERSVVRQEIRRVWIDLLIELRLSLKEVILSGIMERPNADFSEILVEKDDAFARWITG